MIAISEERRNFRKQIITILGIMVSLVGAILSILYGINSLLYYPSYFYLIIALSALTIFGDIVGFFRKAVGIGISFVIGLIGVICAFLLFSPIQMGFFIPVLLILIGGIVGFSANYENLKVWKEQKFPSKPKREAGWEKKLWIPGVILLILGGILIPPILFEGILFFLGIIFLIVGMLLIIYSVIKLRN